MINIIKTVNLQGGGLLSEKEMKLKLNERLNYSDCLTFCLQIV